LRQACHQSRVGRNSPAARQNERGSEMTWFWSWLQQPLVESVGWALLHSLWQGALVACVFGVLLTAMRRQSSQVRYLTACFGLAIISLLPVATLAWCRTEIPAVVPARKVGRAAPASNSLAQPWETTPSPDDATAAPLPTIAPPFELPASNGLPATPS